MLVVLVQLGMMLRARVSSRNATGYAGGIVSAAVDGIRAAEAVALGDV